ncbi:hypothetical protein JKF63_00217 [Porcisia hertigi]|uniref:BRCT domain-containing protein n=1 Tax=Porcisia hertigi TaxID=2761500 RepID=A0A836HYN5_9TRYP|nr:hypothetical protein JKF63_00217 [Porcisia hertigi]
MFRGHTFLVSLAASPLTVAELTQNGGRVVYDLSTNVVTCIIIASNNSTGTPVRCRRGWAVANALPTSMEDHVRANRITVVYEQWVHQCLSKNRLLLPCRDYPDTIAYDPHLFAGVHFTTTRLPLELKANIVALMQFYGATYHPHLLDTTNLLVYSHMSLSPVTVKNAVTSPPARPHIVPDGPNKKALSPAKESEAAKASTPQRFSPESCVAYPTEAAEPSLTKLVVARRLGIPCVTPQWVQSCLNTGGLQPPGSTLTDAPPALTPSPPVPSFSTEAQVDAGELRREEEEIDRWIGEVRTSMPAFARPHSGDTATDACVAHLRSLSPCMEPRGNNDAEEVCQALKLAAQLAPLGALASKTRKRRRAC